MPRNLKTAAASGKVALPQLSAQMLEELIPSPMTKEQFEDIFQNFKKAFIERALGAKLDSILDDSCCQLVPLRSAAPTLKGRLAQPVSIESMNEAIDSKSVARHLALGTSPS